MRSLTEAQIKKLTDMPEWMKQPYYDGRVFASAEGWMIRPSKIHPEFPAKQMPAYCIVAIPELSSYMEATPSDGTASDRRELNEDTARVLSMSYTRRSATRYMVDISLDEEYYAVNGNGDVSITLATGVTGINVSGANLTSGDTYTLSESAAGEKSPRTGVLRFDLRFDATPNSLSIAATPALTINSGNFSTTDSDTEATSGIDSTGVVQLTII